MKTTTTIPTDKNGHVYYGPRTFDQARCLIFPDDGENLTFEEARELADTIESAGYPGVARKVRALTAEWPR